MPKHQSTEGRNKIELNKKEMFAQPKSQSGKSAEAVAQNDYNKVGREWRTEICNKQQTGKGLVN